MAAKFHTLITAGPTRERIDEVRDWGNIFTGRTGLDLALAFLDLGDVTLLTSNPQHAREYDGFYGRSGMLGVEPFHSYADLRALLAERMTAGSVDVAAMSAAVSDYTPAGVYRILEKTKDERQPTKETWVVEDVSAGKVKSSYGEIMVRGVATAKLIDMFRKDWHFAGVLVKFKLEVGIGEEELIRVAEASRVASAADLMVANTLSMARGADAGGTADSGAYLIDSAGAVRVGRKELAAKVVEWVKARRAK